MIVELPNTSTNAVAKKMVQVRESGGAISLGRVLTLVVCADHSEPTEGAIEAAIGASSEHPSRVIVVTQGDRSAESRLDAEIRVGGDAGASEVVILSLRGELANHPHSVVTPFLLPDTPIVTWWPGSAPESPATDPVGALASRRILDAEKSPAPDVLVRRRESYSPGDSDLAWTAITHWRALLASALDRPPHSEIESVQVTGPADSAGIDLLAGWLRSALQVPTSRGVGSFEVRLHRAGGVTGAGSVASGPNVTGAGSAASGPNVTGGGSAASRPNVTVLSVDQNNNAVLTSPGKPDGRVAMTRRELPVLLAEELRRLDADEVYEMALEGVAEVTTREVNA